MQTASSGRALITVHPPNTFVCQGGVSAAVTAAR